MPVSKNFSSVYTHEWQINFTQCTPAGVLKYTELCNILQLTAAYHAELGGISFTDMQAADQAWVLSRMRLEIDRLPAWRDVVIAKTWIISLENSRSVRALELYLGDEKLVGCETFWAVFNTTLRRPEPLALPHAHFIKYADRHATSSRVKKIDTTSADQFSGSRIISVSDLDIVSHVNNVRYLEWCLDLLPPQIILKNQIRSLEMNYMKELLLGDEVTITSFTDGHHHIYSISRQSQKCFALQLETNS